MVVVDASVLVVALYVALAEQLGATLLTADARAARAPGLLCGVELMSS